MVKIEVVIEETGDNMRVGISVDRGDDFNASEMVLAKVLRKSIIFLSDWRPENDTSVGEVQA